MDLSEAYFVGNQCLETTGACNHVARTISTQGIDQWKLEGNGSRTRKQAVIDQSENFYVTHY